MSGIKIDNSCITKIEEKLREAYIKSDNNILLMMNVGFSNIRVNIDKIQILGRGTFNDEITDNDRFSFPYIIKHTYKKRDGYTLCTEEYQLMEAMTPDPLIGVRVNSYNASHSCIYFGLRFKQSKKRQARNISFDNVTYFDDEYVFIIDYHVVYNNHILETKSLHFIHNIMEGDFDSFLDNVFYVIMLNYDLFKMVKLMLDDLDDEYTDLDVASVLCNFSIRHPLRFQRSIAPSHLDIKSTTHNKNSLVLIEHRTDVELNKAIKALNILPPLKYICKKIN